LSPRERAPLCRLDGSPSWSFAVALAGPPDGALDLALGVALGEVLPLVVAAAAAGQGELDLDLAVDEVHRQRHQGEPALAGLTDQSGDLVLVQQQLADPRRLGVGPGALPVLGDVEPAH